MFTGGASINCYKCSKATNGPQSTDFDGILRSDNVPEKRRIIGHFLHMDTRLRKLIYKGKHCNIRCLKKGILNYWIDNNS